ncbi:MAG: hypothetical protein ACREDF_00690 [Thermoplasmata archaeon]
MNVVSQQSTTGGLMIRTVERPDELWLIPWRRIREARRTIREKERSKHRWEAEVIEERHVRCRYVVEAASEGMAETMAERGNTVEEEQIDDPNYAVAHGRTIVSVKRLP